MKQEKYELLLRCISDGRWDIIPEKGIVGSKRRGTTKHSESRGYCQISTTIDGKTYVFKIHQIIAVAAGLNPVGRVINHINGDKTDNRISNLEVVTQGDNTAHAWRTGLASADKQARGERHGLHKLTEEAVKDIKRHLALGDCTQRSLAEKYGVHETKISNIKYGKTWRHVKI